MTQLTTHDVDRCDPIKQWINNHQSSSVLPLTHEISNSFLWCDFSFPSGQKFDRTTKTKTILSTDNCVDKFPIKTTCTFVQHEPTRNDCLESNVQNMKDWPNTWDELSHMSKTEWAKLILRCLHPLHKRI